MDEPRTHYQISLTARQAVGLFAGLLLALGGAFFFGLMAGLSGRGTAPVAEAPAEPAETPRAAATTIAEAVPPVETGVPVPTSSSPSRTELSAGAATPGPEPTAPATVQTFEDGVAEDAAPSAPASNSERAVGEKPGGPPAARAKAPGPAVKPPAPASGRIWVQAASLQSREEANALTARLSKHGFRAVILAATGPKGKVYRVRVGPYRTDDEAGRAVSKLARSEKIREPWIVPEGK